MGINSDFWAQRRVLITGHTGFKGAWLSLWLQALGADLTGLAPGPPTRQSLYELASVGANMREQRVDVRDADAVREVVRDANPEIVLHLAAQPMVRHSLREPVLTYAVNVLGTVNVLDAVRRAGRDVQAVLVVTSDKCYENPGLVAGCDRAAAADHSSRRFVEGDALGGSDPYSSSKACAELVTAAYRRSYFWADGPRVATARAGNVIGGGDWGEDRLLADIVRAVQAGEPVRVRNPQAVRPWQHVLNPLSGYLLLAERLAQASASERGETAGAWNFGPRERDDRTVAWIVERLGRLWDGAFQWVLDDVEHPPEASYLALDSTAAERRLGWRPTLSLEQALERIVAWHEAERAGEDMRRFSLMQLEEFSD